MPKDNSNFKKGKGNRFFPYATHQGGNKGTLFTREGSINSSKFIEYTFPNQKASNSNLRRIQSIFIEELNSCVDVFIGANHPVRIFQYNGEWHLIRENYWLEDGILGYKLHGNNLQILLIPRERRAATEFEKMYYLHYVGNLFSEVRRRASYILRTEQIDRPHFSVLVDKYKKLAEHFSNLTLTQKQWISSDNTRSIELSAGITRETDGCLNQLQAVIFQCESILESQESLDNRGSSSMRR